MSYYVYILQSVSTGRYYIGSSDNLERRVSQHNDPDYHGTRTTKVFQGPWRLVYSEQYDSRSEAMQRERQIKRWKNRSAIERLIAP